MNPVIKKKLWLTNWYCTEMCTKTAAGSGSWTGSCRDRFVKKKVCLNLNGEECRRWHWRRHKWRVPAVRLSLGVLHGSGEKRTGLGSVVLKALHTRISTLVEVQNLFAVHNLDTRRMHGLQ